MKEMIEENRPITSSPIRGVRGETSTGRESSNESIYMNKKYSTQRDKKRDQRLTITDEVHLEIVSKFNRIQGQQETTPGTSRSTTYFDKKMFLSAFHDEEGKNISHSKGSGQRSRYGFIVHSLATLLFKKIGNPRINIDDYKAFLVDHLAAANKTIQLENCFELYRLLLDPLEKLERKVNPKSVIYYR